jgi:hypothetical protein
VGPALGHARHQRQDRRRPIGRLDPGLLVDAEDDRGLGRGQVEPDDVPDLVDELRVGGELEVLGAMGLNPKARQIRLIAVWFRPVASAIERVDQWVAFGGCSSRVFTITLSTSGSVILRGWPGLGSSWRPSRPRAAKRPRQCPTVCVVQPRLSAIYLLCPPSAAARTMRQRSARAWALFGRRAQRSSTSGSESLIETSTRRGIDPPIVASDGDDFDARWPIPAD